MRRVTGARTRKRHTAWCVGGGGLAASLPIGSDLRLLNLACRIAPVPPGCCCSQPKPALGSPVPHADSRHRGSACAGFHRRASSFRRSVICRHTVACLLERRVNRAKAAIRRLHPHGPSARLAWSGPIVGGIGLRLCHRSGVSERDPLCRHECPRQGPSDPARSRCRELQCGDARRTLLRSLHRRIAHAAASLARGTPGFRFTFVLRIPTGYGQGRRRLHPLLFRCHPRDALKTSTLACRECARINRAAQAELKRVL